MTPTGGTELWWHRGLPGAPSGGCVTLARRPTPTRRVKHPATTRSPALSAWRRELAAGLRTPLTFAPLWRAACAEMNAVEFEAAGLPELAASSRRDAERIVRAAGRGSSA